MSHIIVKRKKSESFESAFRRFTRSIRSSGKDREVRGRRYFARKPGKNKVKEKALRGLEKAEKISWQLRAGKITEKDLRGRRRR